VLASAGRLARTLGVTNMPRWLERFATWLGLGLLTCVAGLLSWLPISAVVSQEILSLSKYSSSSRVIHLSAEPTAFWVQWLLHVLLAASAWIALSVAWRRTADER
jgi:hypothetical protein